MTSSRMNRARLAIALLSGIAAAAAAAPAAAQYSATPYREDAGTALSRHLRALADQPRSLHSLLGAGHAALELGDAQAALTFFARGEEVAPRDGRFKAGMGSAFLHMEQLAPAIRFFNEAAALGLPAVEMAKDRGLVYDLSGDSRRAQADYALVLARGEDREVRQRMALSLAISGDHAAALAMIDEQVRRKDRTAWRIRAFVLALSGDTKAATDAAMAVMPAQAAAMQPFFARLPALNPAQRAMAVHFGVFPGDGQTMQMANVGTAQRYAGAGSTEAGRPDARQGALGLGRQASNSSAARRQTGGQSAQSLSQRSPRRASRPNARQNTRSGIRDRFGGEVRTARNGTPAGGTGAAAPAARNAAPPPPARYAALSPATRTATPPPAARDASPPPAARSQAAAAADRTPPGGGVQTAQVQPGMRRTDSPGGQAALVGRATAPGSAQARQAPPPVTAGGATASGAIDTKPQSATIPLSAAPPSGTPVADATAPPRAAPIERAAMGAAPSAGTDEARVTPPISGPGGSGITDAARPSEGSAAPARVPFGPPTAAPTNRAGAGSQATAVAPDGKVAFGPPSSARGIASTAATGNVVSPPAQAKPETPAPGFADLAATIKALPDVAAPPKPEAKPTQQAAKQEPPPTPKPSGEKASEKKAPPKPPEQKKEAAKAETAKAEPKKKAESKKAAGPKPSSRIWVQIAGGADKAALPREFGRLKEKAPKLLGGQTAWTTPLRATNRLLVGPFKTEKDAQEFINQLAKLNLTGFSWTSPAGQEIEKLPAK